jgi:hypothetical protein
MLSICVAIKNRSRVFAEGRELLLFPNSIDSIRSSLPGNIDAELVVADWDSDDWPLPQWLPQAAGRLALHIVPMQGYFSRGRGLNEAARAAKGDVLFFTDADCLTCPELFNAGIRHVNQGAAFFPVLYSYLDPEHREGWWRHSGFGNCILPRHVWEQANGWPEYNTWGKEDEDFLKRVSAIAEIVREEVPGFFHQWHPEDILWKDRFADRDPAGIEEIQQVRVAIKELERLLPPRHPLVLIDDSRFGIDEIDGRPVLPFLESDGEYAGPPDDDRTAIRELERMRSRGATFAAIAWMSFWWLRHYAEFDLYLRTRYRVALANERLILFDLRQQIGNGAVPSEQRVASAAERLDQPNNAAAWEKICLTTIKPVTKLSNPVARAVADLTHAGEILLEAGCGSANLSAELATAGRRIELCDFSQAILERAAQLFKQSNLPPPQLTQCDLTGPLPWRDQAVDVVWSSGVLEHWTDEELVPIVSEMVRVSRRCVISLVPYAGCVFYRLGKYLAETAGKWPYGREIPRSTLAPVFQEAGLSDVREFPVWNEWGPRLLGLTDKDLQIRVQRWWDSLPADDPAKADQGYLLLTVGYRR